MTLSAEEQELLDFGTGALPDWVSPTDPILTAAAKPMGAARAFSSYLFKQALITTSEGPTATTPDWTNQHARDRGTSRQAGESTAALQARLRVVPDALTRSAILAAANAVLTASGVVGQAALIELPRDGAWIGTYRPILQVTPGGVFATLGSQMTFTPRPGLVGIGGMGAQPIWTSPAVFPGTRYGAIIGSADNTANNGTFEVTGLIGNAIVYTNPSGVAAPADSGAIAIIYHMDASGNVTDGFARAYVNRGWRVGQVTPPTILMILPFGTDAGTQASIEESVRLKKAAGYKVIVERRLNP